MKQKGFTLIELLVVIAIIGVLSGVILAAVQNSRKGAVDAKIRQELSQLRATADLVYLNNANTYAGAGKDYRCSINAAGNINTSSACTAESGRFLLDDPKFNALMVDIAKNAGTTVYVKIQPDKWAAAAPLKQGGVWCVDSKQTSRSVTNANNAYTGAFGVSSGTDYYALTSGIGQPAVCN